ncbi:Mu-like prophage FluMu protein gp28 [Devosia enhydra]|uniref:Mu-like prophage FluMu protein gp28 n=1 Tax=Devosia enhydra TaxID=665118 RepID=A0A1K2I156_9HYPH|nr:terminase family protein [Devosia enhydra]SFZ85991.1 Mu-like prophage FluMu protein gp28 [Devosia enhydra]
MSAPFSKEQWAEIRRASMTHVEGGGLVTVDRLPKVLLTYQAEAVRELMAGVSVLVVEKSRRIGLTWGLAAYAALRAAKQKSAGGMDVMYISYSQEMTREFIDACAMWLKAFNLAALEAEEFLFEETDPEGTRSIKAFRIQLASGFEILALSSAPRGLRGKQGVVIIDEAAFVDNLKELLKAALAFLMWGGQVVVCSTHDGAENPFNELVQDVLGKRLPYRHMRIDLDEALQQGLYERICLVRGKPWSPEAEAEWRQDIISFYGDGADEELFCVPSQGSGAWLSTPLIEARMTLTPEQAPVLRLELPGNYLHLPELERRSLIRPFMDELAEALQRLDPDEMHAFGFDFARVADLSVGSLLAIEKALRRREALSFELRNVPGDEQKAITREVLSAAPRLVGAAFDATGMGWTVAEDMGRHFGLWDATHNEAGVVRAIKFSQDWYRLEMPPLKTKFEDAAIALGKDADHLSDLRLVKVIRGIPRVPDVREGEQGKKRHGDYAIALALADYASRQAWTEYAYQPVGDPRARHGSALKMTAEEELEDLERNWWESPLGASLRGSI